MSEWQPIETAPEIGQILIYQPKRELFEGYWSREVIAVVGKDSWGGWQIDYVDGYEWESEIESKYITHWMPLPKPPGTVP